MSTQFVQALKAEIGDLETTLRQLNSLLRVYQQKQAVAMAAAPAPTVLRPGAARAPDNEDAGRPEASRPVAAPSAAPNRHAAEPAAEAKPAETPVRESA